MDQFPNFLMLGGPNLDTVSGSLLSAFEAEGDYAISIIRKLQKEIYEALEVRVNCVANFNDYIEEYIEVTVSTNKCSSSPRWKDYIWEFAKASSNLLHWLCNRNTLVLSKRDSS